MFAVPIAAGGTGGCGTAGWWPAAARAGVR